MNRKQTIIFFFLELISGIGIGLLGTYLVTPNKPKFDLKISIIIGILTICLFALIGIGIIGFFHSRRFWIGIINAFLFLSLGLIIGAILSSLTFDFLPYRISSFYIPILIPILCGVIGFNIGLNPRMKLK